MLRSRGPSSLCSSEGGQIAVGPPSIDHRRRILACPPGRIWVLECHLCTTNFFAQNMHILNRGGMTKKEEDDRKSLQIHILLIFPSSCLWWPRPPKSPQTAQSSASSSLCASPMRGHPRRSWCRWCPRTGHRHCFHPSGTAEVGTLKGKEEEKARKKNPKRKKEKLGNRKWSEGKTKYRRKRDGKALAQEK